MRVFCPGGGLHGLVCTGGICMGGLHRVVCTGFAIVGKFRYYCTIIILPVQT